MWGCQSLILLSILKSLLITFYVKKILGIQWCLILLGCYDKMLTTNRNSSLTVLGWEVYSSGACRFNVWWKHSSRQHTADFSLCCLSGRSEPALWSLLYNSLIQTSLIVSEIILLIVNWMYSLMLFMEPLASWSDHLSKASLPNKITLEIRILTYKFGGDTVFRPRQIVKKKSVPLS